MQIIHGSVRWTALALIAALGLGAQAKAADDPESADREEIVITHSRLGPLSEWAQMQAHSAEYQRLKAKFDPTTGAGHTEEWNSDRTAASPTSARGGFQEESASSPTAPAVQAAKDAIIPP